MPKSDQNDAHERFTRLLLESEPVMLRSILVSVPHRADAREILHRLGMAKAYLGWSRLHYESLGWPDDSESTVAGFQAGYDQILDGVHRFDLDASQGQSIALLTGLRAYFDAAWDRLQGERELSPGQN